MKIVIDMQGAQLEPHPRGIARYIICMVKAILTHPQGHEIILLFNGGLQESIQRIKGYFAGHYTENQIAIWNPAFPIDQRYARSDTRGKIDNLIYEAWLHKLRPDLYLSMSFFVPPGIGFHSSAGHLSADFVTVLTLHDLIPLAFRKLYLDSYPAAAADYFAQIEQFKKADAWLTISDYSAQEAVKLIGLDSARMYNASEGTDAFFHRIQMDEESIQRLRQQYGIHDKFLLYVGGTDPRKNVPALIKAYGLLNEKIRADYQLVIAGSIPSRIKSDLMACLRSADLPTEQVVFTGFIDDETLRSLYCSSRAFVFPTLAEGFGLPALEAMCCETAVIGSGCSSLLEVINNPEAYFDPNSLESMADKMRQVIEDDAFRARLIQHGLEQSKKFSWEDSALRALKFLERVKESTPRKAQHSMSDSALVDEVIQKISTMGLKLSNKELICTAKALGQLIAADNS